MRNYSFDQEPGTERLMMINLPAAEHGGDYRHITASIVRRAAPTYLNSEGRSVYGDGNDAAGYRNCSWSSGKKNAVFVEDFELRCQMTIRELRGTPGEKRIYGSDYAFYGAYKVNSSEAKAMVNTFAKLEKGLSALYDDFGGIEDGDFAGLCQRVAHVLGIKTFLVRGKRAGSNSSLDDKGGFREFKANDLAYTVSVMLDSCYPSQDAA